MSLREQQSKFVYCLSMLIRFTYYRGWQLTLGEGKLLAERKGWLSGKLTTFRDAVHKIGGKHYAGLAIDLNLFIDGQWISSGDHPAWQDLGRYWKSLDPSATWGGDFASVDVNHFSWDEQ